MTRQVIDGLFRIAGIGLLAAMPGCMVPKAQYRAAADRADDAQAQLAATQAKYSALKQEAGQYDGKLDGYEKQLAARREVEDILEQRVENLRRESERLHGELTTSLMAASGNSAMGGSGAIVMASNRINSPAQEDFDLPSELSRAMAAIAGRYEGVAFDPSEKVIRFQTEILFANGDRLRPEGRAALKELAEALASPAAKRFNLQITGHTWGEQQVTRELMGLHPTDWHLAAHQALAVEDCLEAKIKAVRMCVVSYGSWQPLVTGTDDVAHRKNARVEVYIVTPPPLR